MKKLIFIIFLLPFLSIAQTQLNINQVAPNFSTGGAWKTMGRVILPDPFTDGNIVQESNGIYEGSAQLITTSGSVFKIMFTSGNSTNNIYYAESSDGITWVRRSTIGIANHARPCVIKVSGTYYCFCVAQSGGFINVDVYSSSDMLTWTSAATSIITIGGSGTWNHASLANMSVIADGSTYQMLLCGAAVGGGPFTTGYYHSTSITSGWTQYGSNPVMGNTINQQMAPGTLTKIGSTYYAWMFGGTTTGNLPSDIYRYHSSDMMTWTADNSGSPVFARSQGDEGVGTSVGQAANPMLIEASGKTYMFYTADPSGVGGYAYIKLAIANYPMSTLILTNEGNGNALNPGVPYSYEKPASDLRYIFNSLNLNTSGTYTKGAITLTTEFGGVGNGTGIRVRDTTTKTNITVITPDNIAFLKSGVTNNIQGNTSDMTFTTSGSAIFKNGGTTIGTLDNTGQLTTINGYIASASGYTFNSPAFAATNTIGFSARNQTAASSGTPIRWSPAFMQDGTGWTGSASQLIQFNQILKPTSGTNPIGYTYEWLDNINFVGDVTKMKLSSTGTLSTLVPGTVSKYSTHGGKIKEYYTDAGNTSTTETDLYSYTTEAGILTDNGASISAKYGGTFVSSATATRELKIYFGGNVIFDSGALTISSSGQWDIDVSLIRVSSSVIRYNVSMIADGVTLTTPVSVGELTGLTLSSTNILKITGQASGTGAATNDIVGKLGTVCYWPVSI